MNYYKGVSEPVVRAQVEKTLEFVFFGNVTPGSVDLAVQGKLDNSIRIFRNAKAISNSVTLERMRELIGR